MVLCFGHCTFLNLPPKWYVLPVVIWTGEVVLTADASSPSMVSMAKFSLARKRTSCHSPSFRLEPIKKDGKLLINLQNNTATFSQLTLSSKNLHLPYTLNTFYLNYYEKNHRINIYLKLKSIFQQLS